ncbi:MAG TPA: NAD-dependent epimerase/dehydratase family protein [Thermomicrobiales bacterium]
MVALITGGAGFIGSHLADRLIAAGEQVIVLDDLSTGRLTNIEHLIGHPLFRFVEGSVLDAAVVAPLVREADLIYHLAAVGTRRVSRAPLHAITTNVEGTAYVLREAERWGKKVFVASTSQIYGKNDQPGLDETAESVIGPLEATRWLYAVSKVTDECLALAYCQERGLPVVVGRLFNTYGPRQASDKVVPRFIGQALRGEPLTVFGDGTQARCFTYVEDVTAAILALMRTPDAVGQIVNIGSEREIPVQRLAEIVLEVTGSDSPITYVDPHQVYQQGFEDVRRRVPSTRKLRELIGWVPSTPIESGVQAMVGHLRQPLAAVAD